MSTWLRRHGRRNASAHTLAILDEIERKLASCDDPRPTVCSIRIGAGQRDYHDFEVEIELAPGAILAVRYQSVDEEDRRPDNLENERGTVAWHVVDRVRELRSLGTDTLADLLHDLRVRARKTFARWSAEGTHVRLADVRLVQSEYSCREDALNVEVRLTDLDDRLRPFVAALEVDRPEDLEATLATLRADMDARFANQAALARQGADGFVDRLVLNAIGQHWDVAATLRDIAAGQAFGLSEELTVYTINGHVQCHGRPPGREFSWNRNSIILDGRSLPQTTVVALRDRPVTDLIQHPVLSDDMIVTDVTSTFDYDMPSVRVYFEQPRLLFCGASGRVWAPQEVNCPPALGSSGSPPARGQARTPSLGGRDGGGPRRAK